jgi:hypothetical protein
VDRGSGSRLLRSRYKPRAIEFRSCLWLRSIHKNPIHHTPVLRHTKRLEKHRTMPRLGRIINHASSGSPGCSVSSVAEAVIVFTAHSALAEARRISNRYDALGGLGFGGLSSIGGGGGIGSIIINVRLPFGLTLISPPVSLWPIVELAVDPFSAMNVTMAAPGQVIFTG